MEVIIREGISGNQIFEISMQHKADELNLPLQFIDAQNRFKTLGVIASKEIQATYAEFYPHFTWLTLEEFDAAYQPFDDNEPFPLQSLLVIYEPHFNKSLVDPLLLKSHVTQLIIDLDAVAHNIDFYKKKLKPQTKLMVMVKALAYGSGLIELSRFLQQLPIDYLCVAFADEGVQLRQKGIELPILVLNTTEADLPKLIYYDLEAELYDLKQIRQFIAYCQQHKSRLSGHLMLNTGMNRLGLEPGQINELKALLNDQELVNIKACMTHLAASNEAEEKDFTENQFETFKSWVNNLFPDPKVKPICHVLNTGGILRYPEQQLDMVRLGIGLYGYEVNGWSQRELKTISRLKTKVSQIRQLNKGETVGYGRAGIIKKNCTIATLPIGYGDGFLRDYGMGKAYVHVNGQAAYTVGNICMDMCMVDVTNIDVKTGDEVIIFGEDPSISQLANWSNSIPYEVLTQVSERVQRVYVKKF